MLWLYVVHNILIIKFYHVKKRIKMKNILVLAYQISPTKGSEYSVAWNYVTRMAKYNRITVLYGVSGEHMGDTEEMERYADEVGIENVRFICVKPNWWANTLNWCNRHNILRYTFYFAYREWHKSVYHVAKELFENEKFDLIHFVGPIGYRVSGELWKLNIPYIWGPIGGAGDASLMLLKNALKISKLKYCFRNWANTVQLHHNRMLKNALVHTDLLLTSTTENQSIFSRVFHKDSLYLPENAITGDVYLNTEKFINIKKFHFIVIGRLDAGKCISILLEALLLIRNKDKIIIDIVGEGVERQFLEQFAVSHALGQNLVWHGQLPRYKAVELFDMAHMHIITSAKEGNPTTIWEAMSHGVPTMSFDHCGMHDTICERCGVKIPIRSYEQCVSDLAKNIDYLLEHPEKFEQLAYGVLECAKKYTWDDRELFLQKCYDQAIENFKNRIV